MGNTTHTETDAGATAAHHYNENGQYRRYNSYGFLRLLKLQPDDGGDKYLQIGSFSGRDADRDADELERRDREGLHRHPYDRSE
jgi:hypothetical protein